MPKYELTYIVGGHVSDNEIPQVIEEVKKNIESGGGILTKHEEPGKKRLAYPIKNQLAGYYVVDNFDIPANAVNELEHRISTSQNIVRHLIINMEEALVQMEKDRQAQAKLKLLRPKIERIEEPTRRKPPLEAAKKIEIDLDAEIEKALESEDLK